MTSNPFGARAVLEGSREPVYYYRLSALEEAGLGAISRLPYSIKVLLEALLRQVDGFAVTEEDVKHLAAWDAANVAAVELPFKPARVILQDFTGVPAILDLAAMRSAMARAGGDPRRVNPLIPVDLVIDHSVQVDQFGSQYALMYNAEREFERNRERYEFLKWGQKAFDNFNVVPPATGIVHQVNLEFLASVVQTRQVNGDKVAFPDSLVGTDSHTTMINGLGVLGWGVGGIEAEAVMLGQPIYMLAPQVIGFKLTGALPEGSTATDLVLTITQMLRARGVVDKFVEFYGPGLSRLTLPDRATIANMAPEYGATMGFFPVDAETLRYLALSGRSEELVDLVERYCKAQGLFRTDDSPDPVFTDALELDMSTVRPSLAGPRRPQDRVLLDGVKESFRKVYPKEAERITHVPTRAADASAGDLEDGAVVIAAITSCTNTSNPSVMVGAGLVAKKAVERGLKPRPWGKTSLAPGSQVVPRYLDEAGLTPYLEQLGFYTVGYGCTTASRQLRPAARRGGPAHRRGRGWPWLRCCQATASRAACIRSCGRTTSPTRRWLAARWRAPSTSTWRRARLAWMPRATWCMHDLWPTQDRCRDHARPACDRRCSASSTAMSSPATRHGTRSRSPRATTTPGIPSAPTSRSRRSSSGWSRNRPRAPTSRAHGCWRISATA